ncbi:hypothetical protein Tco_0405276 [Tanacetum coccineum]
MLFDNTMKWVDSFVPIDTKVVEGSKSQAEGSKKRTREELEFDNSKKQTIDENVEAEVDDKAKMKRLMEIVPDEEIAVDAIPLATKPPIIIDWKIIKEGKMGYFQIIRANGSSRRYSSMIRMLQNIDREDLETLWKLVKAKHGNTRPKEAYEKVLWGDLKVMSELDVENDEDLSFLPRESSLGFGIGSPPGFFGSSREFGDTAGSVAVRIKDRKCRTRGSKPHSLYLRRKGHLDNQLNAEILNLHDRCYARQVGVDNAVNDRARELLKLVEQMKGGCDVLKEMEKVRDKECEDLKANVKVTSLEAKKAKLKTTKASPRQEIKCVRRDKTEVVSKVVPYVAMELVQSDEMDMVVVKLVSSAIFYGRCHALEEVVSMKEPFDLTKVKGYRPTYKKEQIQAGNNLATATLPFLSEVIADPFASVKSLLSKKPQTLQRPAPTRTLAPAPSSQKDTLSFALVS